MNNPLIHIPEGNEEKPMNGEQALATAVLERWLMDAKSTHLYALDTNIEDARFWCEVAEIPFKKFKEMYKRAYDEALNKDDSGQTVADWIREIRRNGRPVKTSDYKRYCLEHGVTPVNDQHRLLEAVFVSRLCGLHLFDSTPRGK